MIKNILANWSQIIISAAAVFLLYPFFIDRLGVEQYGVWLLISSFIGFLTLLQMGVPLANVRYVSKYYATGEFDKLNGILGANLSLFTGMAMVTMLVGGILIIVIEDVFQIPAEFLKYARAATLIATLEIALRFVFEAVEGVLHARQEFVYISSVKNLIVVVRVALSFLLVTYDYGLIWIAALLLLATIIQSLFFYFFVKHKYPQLQLWPRRASKEVLFEIFGYSSFVLLLQFSSRISFQIDALVLGSVVSLAAVVWFGVANNILLYLTQMIVSISRVLMPKISELSALGLDDQIRSEYLRVVRLTGLLVMPVCLALHLYGGDFIRLWMGNNYRSEMKDVLSILVLGYAFFLVQRGAGFPVMMGMSKMKWPTIIMFIGALVNLMLSILWGKYFGIKGVAWGTTLPTIIVAFLLMIYIARLLKITIVTILKESVCIPLLSLIPLYFGHFIVSSFITITSFIKLFITTFAVSIFCIMGIYFLISENDKNKVLAILNFKE